MGNIIFWHPFGPHGKESPEQIIIRKKSEIIKNDGWTLWSFKFFKKESIRNWIEIIQRASYGNVYVFCSDSKRAKDPGKNNSKGDQDPDKNNSPCATKYAEICETNNLDFIDIPSAIQVLHPFNNKKIACAFKVKKIYERHEFTDEHKKLLSKSTAYEWYRMTSREWMKKPLNDIGLQYPNRGELLLRNIDDGNGVSLRQIKIILELESPFVYLIKL